MVYRHNEGTFDKVYKSNETEEVKNMVIKVSLSFAVGAKFVIANSTAECNKADVNGGSKFNVRVVECRLAAKVSVYRHVWLSAVQF